VRRLGLVGGTSWVSSEHYYRAINEGVAATLGGSHSAPLVLWSVEFGEFARLQHDGDWPGVAKILCDAIPFWLRTYNKEDIPDKIPGTDIIGAQNDRDFENSYACLQKAYAKSSGYSCFAKMYAGWWFRQVGGSAYVPKCPGYENEDYSGK